MGGDPEVWAQFRDRDGVYRLDVLRGLERSVVSFEAADGEHAPMFVTVETLRQFLAMGEPVPMTAGRHTLRFSFGQRARDSLLVWFDSLEEQGFAGFDPNAWKLHAAAAAQAVYDSWQQDADGNDEVYGGGGICDDVAMAVAGVLIEQNVEAYTYHYEQDNHTVVIAKMNGQTVEVDIPMHLYERGSWYSYRKVPGVTFGPEHITVVPLGDEDVFDAMVSE